MPVLSVGDESGNRKERSDISAPSHNLHLCHIAAVNSRFIFCVFSLRIILMYSYFFIYSIFYILYIISLLTLLQSISVTVLLYVLFYIPYLLDILSHVYILHLCCTYNLYLKTSITVKQIKMSLSNNINSRPNTRGSNDFSPSYGWHDYHPLCPVFWHFFGDNHRSFSTNRDFNWTGCFNNT